MTSPCEIIHRPAQATLAIRKRTALQDLPLFFENAFTSIGRYLAELGVTPAGVPYAAYYDKDMDNPDVEIGLMVNKAVPGKGEIQAGEIPAGKYVSTLFIGPCDEMKPVYAALLAYASKEGYVHTGTAYEFFHDGPQVLPESTRTTIMLAIK